MQILDEILSDTVTEKLVETVDYRITHHNADRAEKETDLESKRHSCEHLHGLCGKHGDDDLKHREK